MTKKNESFNTLIGTGSKLNSSFYSSFKFSKAPGRATVVLPTKGGRTKTWHSEPEARSQQSKT